MLIRLGLNPTMANGGGHGGSSSSNQTTNTSTQLTNQVTSTDTRSVASDHAVALGGSGNSVLQNTTTLNSLTNNSGGNSSSVENSGNTSSSIADSGNTSSSTSTVNTTTDFGAVQASINGMKSTASQAMTDSATITAQAINGLNEQSQASGNLMSELFTANSTSSANSQGTAMQALGLANNQTAAATAAVSGAEKSKNQLIYLGAITIVAIIYLLKK